MAGGVAAWVRARGRGWPAAWVAAWVAANRLPGVRCFAFLTARAEFG